MGNKVKKIIDSNEKQLVTEQPSNDSHETQGANCVCFMVRHGERADHTAGIKEVDPLLTEKGVQTSQKTGEFLNKIINQRNPSKVVIVSSPWFRCI